MGCDFPRWGQFLLSGYMILMLVLFTNFYIHAYIRRRSEHLRKQETNGSCALAGDDKNTKHSAKHTHKNGVVTNGISDAKKMK
jgi:GNS1/SUR4 family